MDKELIKAICKVQKKYPGVRLLQLIGNCLPTNFDGYYIEDDTLLESLIKTYPEAF